MVNLLMRFYEINSGDIKIDGVNIKDLSRENIHDLFTMVLQDTWLFNGTVKENIVYNNENVTDEEVIDVCKKLEYITLLKHFQMVMILIFLILIVFHQDKDNF